MSEKIGYKDIFRQKEYMKMIIAALINRFGDSVDAIASAWIVYEVTGNAAWSAVIFALNKIPTVLVTPFAGAWVEGRNKKNIMVVTDIIRAICVAIVATGYVFNFLSAWIIALTTLTISTVEAFRGPANTALTPKILEKKYYEYGMSLMATLSTVVELVGTALAAGIIAVIGTAGAIYLDMLTFILSAVIIMSVHTKEQSLQRQKFDAKEYLATLKDGIAYVKNEKAILFFVGFAVFANGILVPFNSLQAPLTNEILGGGAEVLSILSIMLMAGMLSGSTLYPILRKKLNSRMVVLLCGMGIGLFYLGMILCAPLYENKWFMYMYVAVSSVLFGIVVMIFNSFLNIKMVRQTNENYLARVASVLVALSSAATPIVAFVIGAVATVIDMEWLFIAAGVIDLMMLPFFLRSKVLDEEEERQVEIPVQVATE